MKKIEQLTKEQIDRFPYFVKKWIDIGLSTEPANRKEAEDGIIEMYNITGLKKPKIVWCDSPMSQGIVRAIILKMEADGLLENGNKISSSVRNSVRNSVGDSVRASVWASVWASVRDSVRDSVGDSVRDSVRASVWASVGDSVRDSVGDSVRDSVGDSVRDSVRASVWASVGDSVRDSVGDSVRDSVRASVRDSVWASVWASVGDSVRASVGDSVRDSVGDSVRDSVRASVRDSVWDSVRDSSYGQHDAEWLAFYDFFMEVCKLENETNKLSGLWKISKNAGWFLPHENICWISERTSKVTKDEQGRLHNEHGMSLQYPDGWGIYALHGVRFTEELYKKVISREMSMAECLKITDIDQRVQAIKFAKTGLRDFYKQQGGKMIDQIDKLDKKLRPIHYELWKIPQGDIFNQEVAFAIYNCPSATEKGEEREYSKGVPIQFNSIAEAMAWGMSDDENLMGAKEWLELVPLKDEA